LGSLAGRVVRPHPRLEDQAAAFADTIIAQFRPDYVAAALRHAARFATASEHHMQVEQARWREAEIARNRRKPPRLSFAALPEFSTSESAIAPAAPRNLEASFEA